MRQNAIRKLPSELRNLLLALRIPEDVLAVLRNRNIGVHAATIDADNRLRQEARRHTHLRSNLTADQLVQLNLIGSSNHFTIAVVDLELRRRNLRMVLLVFEAHRPLNLSRRIDELTQRIARQRVIVPALVDILERTRLMVATLSIDTLKQKSFNLVGCVQRITLGLIELRRELFQNAANVRAIRGAVLIDHLAEYHHLACAKHVSWNPVERAPVDAQPQVALTLRGKATDRRAVER